MFAGPQKIKFLASVPPLETLRREREDHQHGKMIYYYLNCEDELEPPKNKRKTKKKKACAKDPEMTTKKKKANWRVAWETSAMQNGDINWKKEFYDIYDGKGALREPRRQACMRSRRRKQRNDDIALWE